MERCLQAMIDTHEAKSLRRKELSKQRILMTNQDAKLVLSAYRPNGADARDPFFEQALEQAKLDPELREWFVKQRAFDRVIVAKLRTIEPPTGLNSQILAGLQAVRVPRHSVSPWFTVAAALLVAMMVLTYNRFLEAIEAGSPRPILFGLSCPVQLSGSIRPGKS